MLSFSEQFLLLAIDPVTGRLFPVPEQVLHLSLAGAILLDASFNSVINDDWEKISVLQETESGNIILDEAIRCLQVFEKTLPIEQAVAIVAAHGSTLSSLVWDSLLKRGALSSKKQGIIHSAHKEESFSVDLSYVINIQKKIRDVVFSDEIPEYDIPPLLSLIEACGLTKYIFKSEEEESHKERITWLANMESLGREIIRAVSALKLADLEKDVTALFGMNHDQPRTFAGGIDAVLNSLSFLYKETGIKRGRKILSNFNQHGGFECAGCAWPNPDKNRSRFEFCENGMKNISSLATNKIINSEFFKKWSVSELSLSSDYFLEQQGRLTEPMFLDVGSSYYVPISWDKAYEIIAEEFKSLRNPDEAVFYSSGRTSNEAAFLYQLFARIYGTNNLPNSANICHEPSGKALTLSLGFGKSSIGLEDFSKSDAIFVFGHNPGSNHARMLSSLQSAVRNGSKIVAVNLMPEASLMGFADPQEARSYLNKFTSLASLFIQPSANGDMAFVRGMAKYIFEKEDTKGGCLDIDFIEKYTTGLDLYKEAVANTSWEDILSGCSLEKSKIVEAAEIYLSSEKVISTWCLGITHHLNAVNTIREIINLMLLRGNIGKPGAGLCPVRGHSNIQGIRTMGVGENMPLHFLESLETSFNIKVPKNSGLSVVPSIKAMAESKVKVLISLGGNLASAVPDTGYVEKALKNCNLTVMISTKLNRSHLNTGKKAIILPCYSRMDEDLQKGKLQAVSVEDAMCKVSLSYGCIPPPSPKVKSEVSVIAEMAMAVLGEEHEIEWKKYMSDYSYLRSKIAETIPALEDYKTLSSNKEWFYLDNPLKRRVFNTTKSKALFSSHTMEMTKPGKGELILMTIRSHDQFNTSIFGLNDRYRGIFNERRVLFMNPEDMSTRNISTGQMVEITSNQDDKQKRLPGYFAIGYPVSKGSVAAYFPEINELLSINNASAECQTPAYKSLRVTVVPQKR